MKFISLVCLIIFPFGYCYSQINNFNEERNYLLSLKELVEQSFTEHYAETDWDEGIRQYVEFDPMSMNLVYYKTPYDEDDNGKLPSNIKWSAKSTIPLFEIDTLIGDSKKNTITIKIKDAANSIQTYAIAPDPGWYGKEYYPASKDHQIIIQSDKLLKVRNLDKRLNKQISDLQSFHNKKMNLVEYLNQKLKREVEYQVKDSLNYPDDRRFKVIQEFQLDNSGQWLSIIKEHQYIPGNPIIEKQSIRLKDIKEVGKDIIIFFDAGEKNEVLKITTIKNKENENKIIETVDNLFFLQLCYQKNNEQIGNELVNLFKQLGQNVENNVWMD